MNLKVSQKDELALLTRNQRNLHFIRDLELILLVQSPLLLF